MSAASKARQSPFQCRTNRRSSARAPRPDRDRRAPRSRRRRRPANSSDHWSPPPSISATSKPRAASRRASVIPAGPAPMMQTSKSRSKAERSAVSTSKIIGLPSGLNRAGGSGGRSDPWPARDATMAFGRKRRRESSFGLAGQVGTQVAQPGRMVNRQACGPQAHGSWRTLDPRRGQGPSLPVWTKASTGCAGANGARSRQRKRRGTHFGRPCKSPSAARYGAERCAAAPVSPRTMDVTSWNSKRLVSNGWA